MNEEHLSVAIEPVVSPENTFVGRFSQSIVNQGFDVKVFSWLGLAGTNLAIFHWPSGFFIASSRKRVAKCLIQIAIMRTYRKIFGVRFVWVVHNISPHDQTASPRWIVERFLSELDGIIVLSDYSVTLLRQTYCLPKSISILKTVHGHYRDDMDDPPSGQREIKDTVNALFFGQIRRYKGVDDLATSILELGDPSLRLTIAGYANDAPLVDRIKSAALSSGYIDVDIRGAHLSQSDLERHIDASHVVILPYKNILNSGTILFALSRNRPVVAPRIGSLPELQNSVGADWVYLYDGEINAQVLSDAMNWLKARPTGKECDLSEFTWDRVGEEIGKFIRQLTTKS